MIKLGSQLIKVMKIFGLEGSSDMTYSKRFSLTNQLQNTDFPCRVCYENEQTQDNPLISVCKCAGSIQSIHFYCLRRWISQFIDLKRQPNSFSLEFSKYQCDLCFEKLPGLPNFLIPRFGNHKRKRT